MRSRGGRRPRGRGLAPQARGAPPLGFPQTLGWGFPTCLGGQGTPLAAAPCPRWALAAAPPPSQGAYIKGGGEGSTLQLLAPPSSPATPLSRAQKLGEGLPESRYIHHHAVVLLLELSSSTSPSSLLDQGAGGVTGLHVC